MHPDSLLTLPAPAPIPTWSIAAALAVLVLTCALLALPAEPAAHRVATVSSLSSQPDSNL